MVLASLPLALSLAVAPVPARAELASTYDQATCATVDARSQDVDGWDRAAIGEDAPAAPQLDECRPLAPPVAADCNDPLVTPWVGEMIGTCDMPRGNVPHPSLRAVRSHDDHRAQRLLAELSVQNDSAAPLGVPAPERAPSPATVAAAPRLLPPLPIGVVAFDAPHALRSVSLEGLLRPPRA